MKKQQTVAWAVLLVMIVFLTPAQAIEVGEPLPEFVVRAFNGDVITPAEMRGRPALVVFWNTWCNICMHELPQINRLTEQFGPRKLTVLAINTAINDSEKKARAYQKREGHRFLFAFDDYFEIGQAFHIRGVPTIFLVDDRSMIVAKFSKLPSDIKKRIQQLQGDAAGEAGGLKAD